MDPSLMSELTRRMTDRSHFLETPSAGTLVVGEERWRSATSLTVRLAPLINERRVKAAGSNSNFLPENPKVQIIWPTLLIHEYIRLSLCGQSLNPFSSRWRFQNSRIAKTCQYFGRFDHDHWPSFCKKFLKRLRQYVKSTSVPKSWYGGRGGGLSQFWQCQISKTPIQTTLPLQ